MNLIYNVKFTRHALAENIVGAGIFPPLGIDTSNFHTALFVVLLAFTTPMTEGSINMQESSTIDGVGDPFQDVQGVVIPLTGDPAKLMFRFESSNFQKRFMRCTIKRTMGSGKLDAIIVCQHGGHVAPVVPDVVLMQEGAGPEMFIG